MSESRGQDESNEVQPNDRLDYLCGVAREILLKTNKSQQFRKTWGEDILYELTAINLMGSDDPTFSLKLRPAIIPAAERSTGISQYTFNKRSGVTYENVLGMPQSHRHMTDEDPVVRKVLGMIRPILWDSQVLSGEKARGMRREFDRIAGYIALEHLYVLRDRPLIRQSIEELVKGINDEELSKKTRQFLVDERKWHNAYCVHDDAFRSSLDRLVEEGIPPEWRAAEES